MARDLVRWSLTLHPRERRLALIALVTIGCWAFVSWLVQPLGRRIQTLRLRVDTQTEKLEALTRLFGVAPAIERSYARAATYLASTSDKEGQRSLLHELEALSQQAGVQLNLKPRPVKVEERMSRFEVELDVEGAQPNLLAFLDALLQMPRLMTIERLRMFTSPANTQVLRANLVIQAVTLR